MGKEKKETSTGNKAVGVKSDKEIIAALELQLKEKEDTNLQLETNISKLEDEKSLVELDSKENDAISVEQIKEKDKAISELKQIVSEKELTITELKSSKGNVISKYPKYKDYEFITDNFRYKLVKHKSEDAVKDEELMEELIKTKSFLLKKVK